MYYLTIILTSRSTDVQLRAPELHMEIQWQGASGGLLYIAGAALAFSTPLCIVQPCPLLPSASQRQCLAVVGPDRSPSMSPCSSARSQCIVRQTAWQSGSHGDLLEAMLVDGSRV